MGTIWVIVGWLVFGLIAGALARFLVPGRDPMGCFGTIAVGIVGSFIGGFLVQLFFGFEGEFQPASWIGSIIGAIILVILIRKIRPDDPVA